ncbi:MAG: hypothetical protein D6754_10875 [Alphaproteobacteria bacterium]|nr:MAG: hypothetical protein D6754_10875 [Alphaproteobacteria bacterium]
MPSWQEYRETARSRGALALELYVVLSVKSGPEADIPAILPAHLAYQAEQEAAGRLAFAGPLSDETGTQNSGDGLIVYRAASLEEARALAEADPMHSSGTRRFTIRRWLINEGSLTLTVGLSGKRVMLS